MAQLTYADTMSEGFRGMKFDSTLDTIDTYANEDATLTGLGIAVCQGTAATQAKKLVDVNSKVLGITIHDAAMDYDDTRVGYAPKAPMNVMTKGRAWVFVDQTVAVGDPVFVRHTASGGNTTIGAFRKDIDTDKGIQLKGARYIRAGSAGGIAAVEFDLAVNRGFTY